MSEKTDKDYLVVQAPTPPDPFRPRTTEEDQFPTGRNPPSVGSTETIPEGKARP